MERAFLIPGRLHPGYSLLGRWLRHRTGDARRAEALHVVLLGGLLVAVLLAFNVAWTLLPGSGATSWTLALWGGGSLLLLILVGAAGWEPAVRVEAGGAGLRVRRGTAGVDVTYDAVLRVETVPALRYHRHYRRYAAVQHFVNRPVDAALLLHLADGIVALGLSAGDRAAVEALVRSDAVRAGIPSPEAA